MPRSSSNPKRRKENRASRAKALVLHVLNQRIYHVPTSQSSPKLVMVPSRPKNQALNQAKETWFTVSCGLQTTEQHLKNETMWSEQAASQVCVSIDALFIRWTICDTRVEGIVEAVVHVSDLVACKSPLFSLLHGLRKQTAILADAGVPCSTDLIHERDLTRGLLRNEPRPCVNSSRDCRGSEDSKWECYKVVNQSIVGLID
jgi:hypothetical protein